MVQKNEKQVVKKTVAKEKSSVSQKRKKVSESDVQTIENELPVNKTISKDVKEEQPLVKKRKPRASKKLGTVADESVVSAVLPAEEISVPVKEKRVRKPRVKKTKEVTEPETTKTPPVEEIINKSDTTDKKLPVENTISIQKTEIKTVIDVPAVVQQSQPKADILEKETSVQSKVITVEQPKSKGEIQINELSTLRDIAEKMKQKPGDLIKKLISLGSLATINQRLDIDTATLLVQEFGYDVKFESLYTEDAVVEESEDPSKLKPRSPVVTIMGHVDHGKTSLLDSIRLSHVADGEAGGITQHIGAYKVKTQGGEITFLDTPGHEAFTAMRSRGAQATDLVVLVVSAADGVMPQTVEAIDHARAANVPIIVAINKIDLPTANPSQVKQELSKYNLLAEDWGGETIMVEVSAKKKLNIDGLLEMILLKAEMMELKANPDTNARGVVIEAKLDSRRGPVATVLIQKGTLHIGDNFVLGITYGKVRAMIDDHGQRIIEATPGTPVEILGINNPPQAGDQFSVVEHEFQAREIADSRQKKSREDSLKPRHHLSLEDISLGKVKELRIILKTDVQGSLGALTDSLERLSTSEINLKIIHNGVGAITESDVTLAAASDAMIIGFNIRPDSTIERIADREGVNIRVYRIIYEIISDVKAAMEGLLEPQIKETLIGKVQVKQVFKISKAGTIAGVIVTDGKVQRNNKVRLLRDNVIVYEGSISSLYRFKDEVKEVDKGYECGLGLENFTDIKSGDIIEAFMQEKIARKL